jgi:hypothetical protein
MSLSPSNNGLYRPLARRAWAVHCERNGLDPACSLAFDRWRRSETWTRLGIYTTKEIRSQEQFDELMLHFATIANDAGEIGYWTRASERRALWRLRKTMANAGVGDAYVDGICVQMGYPLPISELPASQVLKINSAVYMHWRRTSRKGVTV